MEVVGDLHIFGERTLYFEGGPADPNYFLAPYPTPQAAGMRLNGFSGVRLSTGQGDILNVTDAYVGVGTTTPDARLHVMNPHGYGLPGIHLEQPNHGDFVQMWLSVAGNPRWAFATGDGPAAPLFFYHGDDPSHVLELWPDGTVSVPVLQITGGSDLAEPFDITGEQLPAGAVVVIDEANPGQLAVSDRPYDTRVAGIISGAKGIKPGISLRQAGALEGGRDVALGGRVYALAECSNGPIRPGDLLTTSSTPGYCMRATDRSKAVGAIVGKAMTALEEGRGTVLMLVSLQ